MNDRSSDRNLLLGIVALQLDFISRDALIDAMNSWTLAKSRTLSEILVDKGALDPADRLVLESLVERHIARHGCNTETSLSSIEVEGLARIRLESIADSELIESLSRVSRTASHTSTRPDPDATASLPADVDAANGRFQILRLHDEGGLGSVFVARDKELHREVALKQMKEEIASDKPSRARFTFEAEITGNLEHPGVVPVYGKGEYADGRPYYAMRFIQGDTLKDAVDRLYQQSAETSDANERRADFQKLLRRFLVVCETMAYVHSRGVIHRDLKPRNILLGPYGETLIVDWGLAKVIGHHEPAESPDATLRPPSSSDLRETVAGEQRGTAAYMSPEQARGEIDRLGVATDVYSLGSTLFYALTGRPPFTDQTIPEVLRKVGRGEFRSPREVNSGVALPLNAICCKAMAFRPEDRYSSCRLLADDLERWFADLPVSAYPEPLPTQATRWLRRRRQWVAAAAAVLVLAVVGLTFLTWRLGRENERVLTANKRTSAQLQMTRKVLNEQFKLASDGLAVYPNSEKVREGIAKQLLGVYADLRAFYPDDVEIAFDTAEALRILGALELTTGQISRSQASFQRSIDCFLRLTDEPRIKYEATRGLVWVYIQRGELYRANISSQLAQADYRRALDYVELLKDDPTCCFYVDLKASALINRSEVLVLLGRAEEARADAGTAFTLLLSTADPRGASLPSEKANWLIGMSLTDRGVAAHEMNDLESAEKDFAEAIIWLRRIPDHSEQRTNRECQRGVTLARLGILLGQQQSRWIDGAKRFDESVAALEQLVKYFPNSTAYQEELAIALNGRSRLRMEMGLSKESRRDGTAAQAMLVELQKSSPENPQYLSVLSETKAIAATLARRDGHENEAKTLKSEALALLTKCLQLDRERQRDRRRLDHLKLALEN